MDINTTKRQFDYLNEPHKGLHNLYSLELHEKKERRRVKLTSIENQEENFYTQLVPMLITIQTSVCKYCTRIISKHIDMFSTQSKSQKQA